MKSPRSGDLTILSIRVPHKCLEVLQLVARTDERGGGRVDHDHVRKAGDDDEVAVFRLRDRGVDDDGVGDVAQLFAQGKVDVMSPDAACRH